MAGEQADEGFHFPTQIDPALRRGETPIDPADIVSSRLGSRALKDIESRPVATDGFTD